jgi:hypothetical protein
MENETLLRIILALASSANSLEYTEHYIVKKARGIYNQYLDEATDISGTEFMKGSK